MWKGDTLIETGATKPFTFDQSFENVFAVDLGNRTNQQLAENFEAMFFTACLRIAQHAIRLDDLFEQHGEFGVGVTAIR